MTDIAKCGNGETCPAKDLCWRWLAPADPIAQDYMDYEPDEASDCRGFMPNEPERPRWRTLHTLQTRRRGRPDD